jgi:hypothetical protein
MKTIELGETIYGEKLYAYLDFPREGQFNVYVQTVDGTNDEIVACDSWDGPGGVPLTPQEIATVFAARPRFARYFSRANREDRVRIVALLPWQGPAQRNLYSHHTFSGCYSTLREAIDG